MNFARFNFKRFGAIVLKEFIQMRRDRLTFGMMVGVPMIQLILFGYAINSNPKHLPTAVYAADNSVFSRTIVQGLRHSEYFDIVREPKSAAEIQQLLAENSVQFALTIPVDFSRKLLRGEHPDLLLEADATDPTAVGYAIAAVNGLTATILNRDLTGPLAKLQAGPPPFNLVTHQHYNPENITQYNIVPGLMGVMLTMTMVMITALAITRERERGTMENLLSTPVRPGEVLIGKIVPYIGVGYVQVTLILLTARFLVWRADDRQCAVAAGTGAPVHRRQSGGGDHLFHDCQKPVAGHADDVFLFPAVAPAVGLHVSVSGHAGLAQDIGEMLPLTHFLRVVRGILLKGNGWHELEPDLWPMALFLVVMMTVGIKRYRQTLD